MGHEYVEMKNSHAAIEAYRRAVGMVATLTFNKSTDYLVQMSTERITELGMVLAKHMSFSVCITMPYTITNMLRL